MNRTTDIFYLGKVISLIFVFATKEFAPFLVKGALFHLPDRDQGHQFCGRQIEEDDRPQSSDDHEYVPDVRINRRRDMFHERSVQIEPRRRVGRADENPYVEHEPAE